MVSNALKEYTSPRVEGLTQALIETHKMMAGWLPACAHYQGGYLYFYFVWSFLVNIWLLALMKFGFSFFRCHKPHDIASIRIST